jgi:hypothetical protein
MAASERWMNLHSAFSYGRKLETVTISKTVGSCRGGCTVYETVGISLSLRDLEDGAAGKGVAVKVAGRSGEVTIDVPATYVAGFLKRVQDQIEQPLMLTTGPR